MKCRYFKKNVWELRSNARCETLDYLDNIYLEMVLSPSWVGVIEDFIKTMSLKLNLAGPGLSDF